VLVRLSAAAALGAAVGIEREFRVREAGIRTHLLVALGAALFTVISAYGFHEFLTSGDAVVRTDPTRIAAQIVTGIGFLGAGAIIREGLSVRGLTTAGSLWVVAAIGMASGAGFWWAAIVTTALTIFALGPLRFVAYRTLRLMRPEENRLIIELKPGQDIGPFFGHLGDVRHFELEEEHDRRIVQVELAHIDEQLVAKLSDLDYVIGVRWRR
jgi:putative Mg2+ transporter-C (MgtC) family protein